MATWPLPHGIAGSCHVPCCAGLRVFTCAPARRHSVGRAHENRFDWPERHRQGRQPSRSPAQPLSGTSASMPAFPIRSNGRQDSTESPAR